MLIERTSPYYIYESILYSIAIRCTMIIERLGLKRENNNKMPKWSYRSKSKSVSDLQNLERFLNVL